MKRLNLFIAGLCVILTIYGCGNNGPKSWGGVGFFPEIRDGLSYNVNDPDNPVIAYSFKSGDKANFNIYAEEPIAKLFDRCSILSIVP